MKCAFHFSLALEVGALLAFWAYVGEFMACNQHGSMLLNIGR